MIPARQIGRHGLAALATALADGLWEQPGGLTSAADGELTDALAAWARAEHGGAETPTIVEATAARLLRALLPAEYIEADGAARPEVPEVHLVRVDAKSGAKTCELIQPPPARGES